MSRSAPSRETACFGPLVLVNAGHPLHPDSPPLLTPAFPGFPDILLERQAAAALEACVRAVGGQDEIVPVSGWRSRSEQQQIWDSSLAEKGDAFTRQYVALPGCSEHQTGLAIDLGKKAPEIDFICPDFPEEGICGAFRRAAPRYGFIQRYQAGKEEYTGIAAEPWHFRYVGVPHALLMTQYGLCLEEYLLFLRDAPHTITLEDGRSARILFVPSSVSETELELPEGRCQISGDNCGGLILTVWEAVS